jgi:hypothetical protein
MDKQMSINYNPRRAWMRATVYFVICFAVAHFTGALALVLRQPLASAENLRDVRWILFTLLCVAVEVWGYVYLWPRGTLTHHYWTDERGVVTKANLIVGTTNNYAPIQMSTTKAAQNLIKGGKVNEGLLNMIEMAFRAYDPCFGCATHSLPGQMPLVVTIHNADGEVVDVLKQFVD